MFENSTNYARTNSTNPVEQLFNHVNETNLTIQLFNEELPNMQKIWICGLVTVCVFTAIAIYMLFKSRKVERRNFFVASCCLSIVYFTMLATIYKISFMLV